MKKLEELKSMLYVVDMVNGFLKEGNMKDESMMHIVPAIQRLVEKTISDNEGLAFIKDCHSEDAVEFKKFPVHCLKGTSESEVIDELKQYERYGLVYEKNSTSAIFAPGFLSDLEKMKSLEIVRFVGVCSDICDINVAVPVINYFDQNNRDVKVEVPENMIDTFDAPYHMKDEYTSMALKLMKQSGINIERR